MARSRNIKPSIMENEELAELEPIARLLFIYLWMLADREGRLEDRPKRIAGRALPYDRDADVDNLLNQLAGAGFITRYMVGDQALIRPEEEGRAIYQARRHRILPSNVRLRVGFRSTDGALWKVVR